MCTLEEEVSHLAYMYICTSLNYLSSLTAAPVIDTPSSSAAKLFVGAALTLSCTSRGSPPDIFTWRKDNGPILQSFITPVTYNEYSAVFHANYSTDRVTKSDSGIYTCTVTNPIGSNSATITINVIGKLICCYQEYQLMHVRKICIM